jgi:hypothetical protein
MNMSSQQSARAVGTYLVTQTRDVRIYLTSSPFDCDVDKAILETECFAPLRAFAMERGVSLSVVDVTGGAIARRAGHPTVEVPDRPVRASRGSRTPVQQPGGSVASGGKHTPGAGGGTGPAAGAASAAAATGGGMSVGGYSLPPSALLRRALAEIDACAPFFIALVGQTVGPHLGDATGPAVGRLLRSFEIAESAYPWVKTRQALSLLELEIEHAAFRNACSRSFIAIRDEDGGHVDPQCAVLRDRVANAVTSVASLVTDRSTGDLRQFQQPQKPVRRFEGRGGAGNLGSGVCFFLFVLFWFWFWF